MLDHARRWGREGTLPDPASAGSDVLINSDIAVQLLFQLLYPPADFIYFLVHKLFVWPGFGLYLHKRFRQGIQYLDYIVSIFSALRAAINHLNIQKRERS